MPVRPMMIGDARSWIALGWKSVALLLGVLVIAGPARAGETDVKAEFALAQHYEHGEGVPQDYAHARALYCDASRQGNADAAFNLGWMYLNARGVPRNDPVGAAWLRLAAARGNPQAPHLLALLGHERVVEPAGCPTPRPVIAIEAPPAIVRLVTATARKYHVDPQLVLAVIAIESGFQVNAVSPRNAQGLMQLMPETAERFGVKDVFDPAQNIAGGVRYLRWLLGYFDGDLSLVLAAYNAGETAVMRFGGVPPYAETRTYLQRISTLYPVSGRLSASFPK